MIVFVISNFEGSIPGNFGSSSITILSCLRHVEEKDLVNRNEDSVEDILSERAQLLRMRFRRDMMLYNMRMNECEEDTISNSSYIATVSAYMCHKGLYDSLVLVNIKTCSENLAISEI